MKISRKGKARLREAVEFHLSQTKSGVPQEGIAEMLTHWVTGLLENQTEELRKELEEE